MSAKKSSKSTEVLTGAQDLYDFLYKACDYLRGPVGHESFKDYLTPLLYYKRLSDVWDEEYAAEPIHNKLDFIGPKTVPDGCVFVLGDNRNSSRDSRAKSIGMVDERLILGKVYAVVYPIGAIRWVR